MRQAKEALPGGTEADWQEWVNSALKTALGDARDLPTFRSDLDKAQRGADTFRSRAGWQGLDAIDRGASVAAGMYDAGRPGLGLGGEYDATKSRKNRQAEAAAEKEAAKIAQQKADNAGLIAGITDPITAALGKTLLAEVTNAEEIGRAAGGKPAKGSDPVPWR